MSRDSTPATLIGALAISGSPGSSNSDMPVITRGMHNQRQRNLVASQHASSGAAAGSFRAVARSSGQHASMRSSGRAGRRPSHRRRSRRTRVEEDDAEDDGDDDSSHDGDSNRTPGDIVNEMVSIFTDTYLTPREFSRILLHPTRSTGGSEQTGDCLELARILSGTVDRYPEVLRVLRGWFTREYCAGRLVNNLWKREEGIMRSLQSNLEDQAEGRDVPFSIEDWRSLNGAIENVLTDYWEDLSQNRKQSLASLLIWIFDRICRADTDLYAGRTRAIYAGESNGGNLFRRFITARAEPIAFLGPLQRLDANLLASQRAILREVITRFGANGPTGSETDQYNRVEQTLRGIWARANGGQA